MFSIRACTNSGGFSAASLQATISIEVICWAMIVSLTESVAETSICRLASLTYHWISCHVFTAAKCGWIGVKFCADIHVPKRMENPQIQGGHLHLDGKNHAYLWA